MLKYMFSFPSVRFCAQASYLVANWATGNEQQQAQLMSSLPLLEGIKKTMVCSRPPLFVTIPPSRPSRALLPVRQSFSHCAGRLRFCFGSLFVFRLTHVLALGIQRANLPYRTKLTLLYRFDAVWALGSLLL